MSAPPATPRPDVSIATSGHDVADARLHREVAAMVAAGLRVEVLGLGDPAGGPPGSTVRTWSRRGPVGRAALAGLLAWQARGTVVMTLEPDSALASWLVTRIRRRRLVVDVQEDYRSLLRDRPWALGVKGRVAAGLVAVAQRVAARADLTVVADEHVPPARAVARLVVRNLPDLSMLPAPGAPAQQPRALYVGDVRSSRGLFAMVEAVRQAPGWQLDVVGPISPRDEPELSRVLAADPSLAARLHLRGRLPPRQAWIHADGAWVGMLLLEDTPAFHEAMPSKAYEYLACGLPVVTTDLPRQAALIRDAGAGVVVDCGDAQSVGRAVGAVLRSWSGDPARLTALRTRATAYARDQAADASGYSVLADRVRSLVGTRPGQV